MKAELLGPAGSVASTTLQGQYSLILFSEHIINNKLALIFFISVNIIFSYFIFDLSYIIDRYNDEMNNKKTIILKNKTLWIKYSNFE
jgi:hypothetical protein